VGFDIDLETVQQDALIDRSISGEFDMQAFRNYPGGDPDELYVWFQSASPVNFGRIDDPEIDRLLDDGRSETDPEARVQIYQDLNRRFGEQLWQIWFDWTDWTVAARPEVHGFTPETMPTLPDGEGSFTEGIVVGHPLHGLWVEQ
jgi:peptide/nickel transport system substrate-binding protein